MELLFLRSSIDVEFLKYNKGGFVEATFFFICITALSIHAWSRKYYEN
jgi:hypothetical protein